jgi:curli biogenesis system outer membrane secretion channel CsgG
MLRTMNKKIVLAALAGLLMLGSGSAVVRSESATPISIAVFDFELDDVTPASALLQKATSSGVNLQKATDAAKRALTRSGRYRVIPIDVPTKPQPPGRLQDCNGCEAAMALPLGAQQSMIGLVRRATQTDYYIEITIRDTRSGEIVNQQAANFAGGEEGWATGVRILLDHQVLYPDQPERLSTSDDPSVAK